MGRTRRRHNHGWIVLEKRTTPHRWVAHWYLHEPYRDAKGALRYKQGAHVLGLKTKDDLPTKSAAQRRWEERRDELIQGARNPTARAKPDPTFRHFLNEEFIPVRRQAWNGGNARKT